MYGASISQVHFVLSFSNVYTILAIDYVFKWVEDKAICCDDAKIVVEFLKNFIFSELANDRGTHFCNKLIDALLKKYKVT